MNTTHLINALLDDSWVIELNDEIDALPVDDGEYLWWRDVDDSQLTFDLFDYDAEAEDYEEDILDRQFWAEGKW